MRYSSTHKRASRQRLVAAAGRHAKQHGFDASAVVDLAAAADMTTGALYKHFAGKAELFAALVAAELQRTAALYGALDPDDRASAARALAGYLSRQHVLHPGQGCPLPSLTAEIARADDATREAYTTGLLQVHAALRRFTKSSDAAWVLLAQNVGAVMLARALDRSSVQRALLGALRTAGEALLKDE